MYDIQPLRADIILLKLAVEGAATYVQYTGSFMFVPIALSHNADDKILFVL